MPAILYVGDKIIKNVHVYLIKCGDLHHCMTNDSGAICMFAPDAEWDERAKPEKTPMVFIDKEEIRIFCSDDFLFLRPQSVDARFEKKKMAEPKNDIVLKEVFAKPQTVDRDSGGTLWREAFTSARKFIPDIGMLEKSHGMYQDVCHQPNATCLSDSETKAALARIKAFENTIKTQLGEAKLAYFVKHQSKNCRWAVARSKTAPVLVHHGGSIWTMAELLRRLAEIGKPREKITHAESGWAKALKDTEMSGFTGIQFIKPDDPTFNGEKLPAIKARIAKLYEMFNDLGGYARDERIDFDNEHRWALRSDGSELYIIDYDGGVVRGPKEYFEAMLDLFRKSGAI